MGSGRARGILRKMQVLRLRPSGFAQDDNSFVLHRVSDSPGIRRKTTEILRSAQNDGRWWRRIRCGASYFLYW